MAVTPDHWQKHAAQWRHLGPPLRPCPEDVAIFAAIGAGMVGVAPARPRALLLGVTPELALMQWPAGTRLLAIDRAPGMIALVWPKHQHPDALAILGNWRSPPLAADSLDLVVGDGCFTILAYPTDYHEVARALREILAESGTLALRFFVRPDQPEPLEQVLADLRGERIGSFHACKWRLAMALHGPESGAGVRLAEIRQAWQAAAYTAGPDSGPGWSPEAVATIDNYRGVESRYSFPTLAEVRQVFGEYFREEACCYGTYELAERCPIMVFRPRI